MYEVEIANPDETWLSPNSELRRSSRLTGKPKPIYTDPIGINYQITPPRERGGPSKKAKSPKKENSSSPFNSASNKRGSPAKGGKNRTRTSTGTEKNEEASNPKSKMEKRKRLAPKNTKQKIKKSKLDPSLKFPILEGMNFDYDDNQNENGNENRVVKSSKSRVVATLRTFNKHHLQCVQEEQRRVQDIEEARAKKEKDAEDKKKEEANDDKEEVKKRASKRPDLKAITKMFEEKSTINHVKRLGHVPGVEVGKQFNSHSEMVVVGLHSHWLNGIDYMGKEFEQVYDEYKFPLAVCICLSGQYADDQDNLENVTYTGHGGHDILGNKKQIADQKLERGNLALANSCDFKTPVRLVRKHRYEPSYTGNIYTYDGLYMVTKYWAAKGDNNYIVYKYSLERLGGQTDIKSSQVKYCGHRVDRLCDDVKGFVCRDISKGQENFPIPASNSVDAEPAPPTGFKYSSKLQIPSNLKMPKTVAGCNCIGDCAKSRYCPCARLNESDFAYVRTDGVKGVPKLMGARSVVFECGDGCKCNSRCINRTSQQGIKYRLEVFKTPNKGWAVRSWDAIPAGAPVCEYTGILRRSDDVDANRLDNIYLFDIDCLETMKGNDGREKREGPVVMTDDDESCVEYCIDAGKVGNVSRFINHSCQPNLFVQSVMSSHRDFNLAKVMLFAFDNIPPLQELCYDYGYALDSVVEPDGIVHKLECHCEHLNAGKGSIKNLVLYITN